MEEAGDDIHLKEAQKQEGAPSQTMDSLASTDRTMMMPHEEVKPCHRRRERFRARLRARLRAKIDEILKIVNKPIGDIIRDNALQHLPPRSLLRFRSVSTSWCGHISTPLFSHAQSHTYRSITGVFLHYLPQDPFYFPFHPAAAHAIPDPNLAFLPRFDSITVRASSHGLICCRGLLHSYYIANPATMEWTALPEPPSYVAEAVNVDVALVFEPSVHNLDASYRLICTHRVGRRSEGIYGFHVFSSETGEWTGAADVCPAEKIVAGSGVSANGVAYWRSSMQTVVAYDPADGGGCRIVPWPMGYEEAWWQLGEMDGRLCCVCVTKARLEVHALEPSDRWTLLRAINIIKRQKNRSKGICARKEEEEEEEEEGGGGGGEQEEEKSLWMYGGDGNQLVFLCRPWPLRFQSGKLEVMLLADNRIICLDLASGRAREVCDIVTGINDDYVLHINTFARVFPQIHCDYE